MATKRGYGILDYFGEFPHSKPPCIEFVGWYALAFLMQYKYKKMEIIYFIFGLINVIIVFWALVVGIGALIKGWPKILNNKDKIFKRIFLFYVWIVSIIVWLYIIGNGFSQLKSEIFEHLVYG